MSRSGIAKGHLCLFTHRDPQTGRYWTDDYKNGSWIESNEIDFFVTKEKNEKESKRKRGSRR